MEFKHVKLEVNTLEHFERLDELINLEAQKWYNTNFKLIKINISTILEINDEEDLPCFDWKNIPEDYENCPMRKNWKEGQVVMCGACGNLIGYNCNDYFSKIDES